MSDVTKKKRAAPRTGDPLAGFHPATRAWFATSFDRPTAVQAGAFPALASGSSTLLLAPTGSGKTLAAFLSALDRLAFGPPPESAKARCRVLYVSPLKALAVDVERNLRAPLAGLAREAGRLGVPMHDVTVEVRSGDTAAKDRARMAKRPPDILVTTPESLYLMLTSAAQASLTSVETVIIDEIHSMLPTKRGAHLFLSLERLERLVARDRPLTRVGLSATVRPIDEAARLLGGFQDGRPRPVTIVDARAERALEVSVEVPDIDMARLGEEEELSSGPAAGPAKRRSIWPALYPRLVELVRAHRSTMLFVNSRRLAERLASALNEEAGEPLAAAHHGSLAREQRVVIEDRLKRGELPAIVATSSLELGIDMGSVDLVIQIEAPPSVSAGLQRIGRASHQVGGTPRGVIFPKHRGDLLGCAAASERILAGDVEASTYPRLPLDVLAQQIVAIVAGSSDEVSVDALFALVRSAAPFAELPRSVLEGVLDMLSGRYPSDDFAGLRARVTWDRVRGTLTPRAGALRLAVVNGGTIPDRGLFGVFLASGDEKQSRRVGELDEEMVFETRVGDVFLLGSSGWRVEEITHDRVLVTPAPGESGKMPFWKGDGPGRTRAFGLAIGALARTLRALPAAEAEAHLRKHHVLGESAARNLVAYVGEQIAATGEVPSDRTIVVERFRDELGDLRVAILSPLGARVHAPWAAVLLAELRGTRGLEAEAVWTDDGIVLRLPEMEEPPETASLFPAADEIESLVTHVVSDTALFASKFREAAGRALLLPRRHPGQRTALWKQRKRAADLLAVAARYPSFPLVLEAYREVLKDTWDLAGLSETLADVASRKLRVVTVDTKRASPFASSLMFGFAAAFLYDGDLPLAERRAHALRVDPAELARVLGAPALSELLDAEAVAAVSAMLQRTDGEHPLRHADDVHDALLSLGDLSPAEIGLRGEAAAMASACEVLVERGRALSLRVGGELRLVAVEDAARYRDALGIPLPRGVPDALLGRAEDALVSLVARYARTHGPFLPADVAARFGLGIAAAEGVLAALVSAGRVVDGDLIPGAEGRAFVDAEVLRLLRRRSLAKLRAEIEPVDAAAVGRFLPAWQGLDRPRRGREGLLAVVQQLEGAPLVASTLESEILPARVAGYATGDLDAVLASGEVVWAGLEPLGSSDGRVALYLAEHEPLLARTPTPIEGELQAKLRALFEAHGALFFGDLARRLGGYPREIADALWDLVWAGEVTNDTLLPLRAFLRGGVDAPTRPGRVTPGLQGRWSLRSASRGPLPPLAERAAALARSLLERHGVVTRDVVVSEGIAGGFSAVYPVFREMEARAQARRGYFVAGAGALQFALPGADDRLRAHREDEGAIARVLSATDPANPYGASLPWPARDGARMGRAAGASVVLASGALVGFLARGGESLLTFLPEDEPARGRAASALARALADHVDRRPERGVLIATIDGAPPTRGPVLHAFLDAGFVDGAKGLARRRRGEGAPRLLHAGG